MHGLGASSHLTSELAWEGGAGLGGADMTTWRLRVWVLGACARCHSCHLLVLSLFSFGWSLGKGYHRVK